MIITHNGFSFLIDTSDWSDSAAADQARSKMEDWVLAHGAEETAALHSALKGFEEGDDSELAQEAHDAGNSIVLEVTRDWFRTPDEGHNCEISAA